MKETIVHTGEEFESIQKFGIGNQFNVTLRIVSPTVLLKQNGVKNPLSCDDVEEQESKKRVFSAFIYNHKGNP